MPVYFSLGSNLGNRKEMILRAIDLLSERVGAFVACSEFKSTAPVGFQSDHAFLNAAALFTTSLPAEEILNHTEAIERELGRDRKSSNGNHFDRCIDIDLLFLDNQTICTPRLTLPHPHLHKRRFVLEPLAEIAPHFMHPTLNLTVKAMLENLNKANITRLSEATPEATEGINRLLTQLTANPPAFSMAKLAALIHTPLTHLFILRDEEDGIRGMATLCICSAPTGTKAWIEDVVVDAECRGRGYGRKLIDHLTATAFSMNAKCVMLTSRPSRIAANALYQKVGFDKKETNVYQMTRDSRANSKMEPLSIIKNPDA